MEAVITVSDNPKKKYKVVITKGDKKKTIHFGQAGASDYTQHKDTERKDRYLARHKKRENWKDPFTASFWATNLLWNKPSLYASIKSIQDDYGIKIKSAI